MYRVNFIFSLIVLLTWSSDIYCQTMNPPSLVWEKTYGGSTTDEFFDIQNTIDNNLICVGTTSSDDGDNQSCNVNWIFHCN